MRAFCNTFSDFHKEKADLAYQISVSLNMPSFKNSIMNQQKYWYTDTNLDFSVLGKLV